MNKEELKDFIDDLENEIYMLKQYRTQTNDLCNKHISKYDYDNFKEENGIYNFIDDSYFDDYDYDIYNFIYIKNFDKAVELLRKILGDLYE